MTIFPSRNESSHSTYLTRRRFLGAVTGVGLATLLLAGCAPGDDDSDDSDDDDDDDDSSKRKSKSKSKSSSKSGGKRR